MVDYRIVVHSGIVFDFNNMLGAGRLQPQEVEQALQQQGAVAEKAVCERAAAALPRSIYLRTARLSMFIFHACRILLTATPILSSRLSS